MMVRPSLAGFPREPVPAPFFLRSYRPGDEKQWYGIHIEADRYSNITPELFEKQFTSDARQLAARQIYLCNGAGRPVGTITAWRNEHFPGHNWGRVHWVAIIPQYQGRGLARGMLSACLERLEKLMYDGAYLTTSTVRTAAVNLYLRYGFRPCIAGARDVKAWRSMLDAIKPEYRAPVQCALARRTAR